MSTTYTGGTADNQADSMFSAIMARIESASTTLKQGEDVDLTGLDIDVQRYCELVLSFPQQEALEYEDSLQNLSRELNELQSLLEEAQDEVREELDGVNAHHHAAKAYRSNDMGGGGSGSNQS